MRIDTEAGMSESREAGGRRCGRLGGARTCLAVTILALFSIAGGAGPGIAQSSRLEGSWRGGGYVAYASGDRERVTCRATYSRLSGDAYSLDATCASPSGSVSQSATVIHRGGGTYRGDIFNVQYNTYGSIVVVVSGNTQNVTLRGQAGSGHFTLTRR
jgi:hypothetical protein